MTEEAGGLADIRQALPSKLATNMVHLIAKTLLYQVLASI